MQLALNLLGLRLLRLPFCVALGPKCPDLTFNFLDSLFDGSFLLRALEAAQRANLLLDVRLESGNQHLPFFFNQSLVLCLFKSLFFLFLKLRSCNLICFEVDSANIIYDLDLGVAHDGPFAGGRLLRILTVSKVDRKGVFTLKLLKLTYLSVLAEPRPDLSHEHPLWRDVLHKNRVLAFFIQLVALFPQETLLLFAGLDVEVLILSWRFLVHQTPL